MRGGLGEGARMPLPCPRCGHLLSVHSMTLETIAPDRQAAFLTCRALGNVGQCPCRRSWRTSP